MAARVLRRRRLADGPETLETFGFTPGSDSPPVLRF